ncbi:hypothetical protein DXG03_004072 [Asterophora parasitica]|uniref:Uncharacterized protein n=1 Tax=Asterophora parasitica TaxID=117018 RepID=A0A9P7KEV4_9AGAR|nr:hypothetical protein DXG03_004072 [Asterophora parasitica]
MSDYLIDSNAEWAARAAQNPNARRHLDTAADPFVVRTYVVLVLLPDVVLPDNKPVAMNKERRLRPRRGYLPASSDYVSWVLYRPQQGGAYLVDDAGRAFDRADFNST